MMIYPTLATHWGLVPGLFCPDDRLTLKSMFETGRLHPNDRNDEPWAFCGAALMEFVPAPLSMRVKIWFSVPGISYDVGDAQFVRLAGRKAGILQRQNFVTKASFGSQKEDHVGLVRLISGKSAFFRKPVNLLAYEFVDRSLGTSFFCQNLREVAAYLPAGEQQKFSGTAISACEQFWVRSGELDDDRVLAHIPAVNGHLVGRLPLSVR